MSPVATGLVAGALVIGGKWSQDKAPNIDNAVGIAGIAIGLALIEQASERLANAFAALILVSLAIVYLPSIVKAVGFSK